MLRLVSASAEFLLMDIPHCPNCFKQLPAQASDVIRLAAAGGSYQERQHCCPHCHSVLSIEVVMAQDERAEAEESLTMSKLRLIEL